MTINSLRNTVESALPRGVARSYSSYVAPVVTALESRETEGLAQIAASLRASAQSAGYDMEGVNSALADAGLPDAPAPVVEAPAVSEGHPTDGLREVIDGLRADVARLTAAAERHGVRV